MPHGISHSTVLICILWTSRLPYTILASVTNRPAALGAIPPVEVNKKDIQTMRTSLVPMSILLLTVCGLCSAAASAFAAPEPGTIMLAASGVALAGFVTWRRRK